MHAYIKQHSQPVTLSGDMSPVTHTSTSLDHVLSPLAKLPNTSTSKSRTSEKARFAQARTLRAWDNVVLVAAETAVVNACERAGRHVPLHACV